MRTVLFNMVEEQEHTEFLLVPSYGDFFYCCLKAVLEIRARFPNKTIVTFVVETGCHEVIPTPMCIVDRIREVDVPPSTSTSGAYIIRYLQRCMIQLSTHMVCYVYNKLFEYENSLLAYARGVPKLMIVDMSEQETAKSIHMLVNKLPEQRERFVVEKLDAGFAMKEIGAMLGVSTGRVHQIRAHAGRHLRDILSKTLPGGKNHLESDRQLVCAIFSLGSSTIEKLKAFQSTISLLVSKYHVTTFEIQAKYCHSDYIMWAQNGGCWDHPYLTAVLIDDDDKNIHSLVPQYCPPCKRVANIDATLIPGPYDFKVGAAMMERADFCVCDLSESPVAEGLTEYAARSKWVCLLDIGRNSFGG